MLPGPPPGPPLGPGAGAPVGATPAPAYTGGAARRTDPSSLVVVPVRSFSTAKARLAGVLSGPQRSQLARRMAAHVVAQCRRTATVAVVSGDPEVLRWAETVGAVPLPEHPGSDHVPGGLNTAVAGAASWALSIGVRTFAVVHGDLPLLQTDDVAALLRVPGRPGVRIAPDRFGTGTNALSCSPPDAGDFAFGPDSLRRHRALAHRRGVRVTLLRRPGLECDVDTPDDLLELAPSFAMDDFDPALFLAGLQGGRR